MALMKLSRYTGSFEILRLLGGKQHQKGKSTIDNHLSGIYFPLALFKHI